MKKIRLLRGEVCLVDDDDFSMVSKHSWYSHCGYATAHPTKYGVIRMHRLILSLKSGEICDHINGDKLDNRKKNLRVCTSSQNLANRGSQKNSRSGIKGVTFYVRTGKWAANIAFNRKQTFLGYFLSKEEAASAYNQAAIEHHGEFARLNKIKLCLKNQ